MEKEGFLAANGESSLIGQYCPHEKEFYQQLNSWYQAIVKFPGIITPRIIHGVIKEMSGTFLYGISNGIVFDIKDIAAVLFSFVKEEGNEKEIALNIAAHLPSPAILKSEAADTLLRTIKKAGENYPEVSLRFEPKVLSIIKNLNK